MIGLNWIKPGAACLNVDQPDHWGVVLRRSGPVGLFKWTVMWWSAEKLAKPTSRPCWVTVIHANRLRRVANVKS